MLHRPFGLQESLVHLHVPLVSNSRASACAGSGKSSTRSTELIARAYTRRYTPKAVCGLANNSDGSYSYLLVMTYTPKAVCGLANNRRRFIFLTS